MKITARTENQKKYLKALYTEDFVICEAMAGVGKDYVAIGVYLDMVLGVKHKQDKLIITRPLITCGSHDIGSLPGSLSERTLPYALPIIAIMNELLGVKDTRLVLEKKIVEFIPLELMRGYTFTNSCVLLSEMQNSTPQQAIMAITRMGLDSHFCFNGDPNQKDIRVDSGLEILIDTLSKTNLCAYIKMGPEDNQRNPKINAILKAIDWQGAI
jgi:phosphate starvation-inducible PhoH-like protein